MKLIKRNYYGFDHKMVSEKFSGDLTYVNDFCLKGTNNGYVTVAVYHAKSPDRSKGHKEFMLLYSVYEPFMEKSQYYVSGRELDQMKKESKVQGIWCKDCDSVIYSVNRHHFHKCGCANETFVDGGRDYTRYGGKSMTSIELVEINLLTDKIKKIVQPKRSQKRAKKSA